MRREDADTPRSSGRFVVRPAGAPPPAPPPQSWNLKNALGRTLFGESFRSDSSSQAPLKSKGRLFNSNAVHVAHKSNPNVEEGSAETSRADSNAPPSATMWKKVVDNKNSGQMTTRHRVGQLKESVVGALKKTRVGQYKYDKSSDNYKTVLSPTREGLSAVSSSFNAKTRSQFAVPSPNGAVIVDKTSGFVRFTKPAVDGSPASSSPTKTTESKSADEVNLQQWRKGMVRLQLENGRERRALVDQLSREMDEKLAEHQRSFTHKSSPTKVYGLTSDFDDTASEGGDSQGEESSKGMRLNLSPIPQLQSPTLSNPEKNGYFGDFGSTSSMTMERPATPDVDIVKPTSTVVSSPIALPQMPIAPPPTVDRSEQPSSPTQTQSRLHKRTSGSLFPAAESTTTVAPTASGATNALPRRVLANSHAASVAANSVSAQERPSAIPPSPAPQPTSNIDARLCSELSAACKKLRQNLNLVENENVRQMQLDVLVHIERKLGANPDMVVLGKLAETLANLSATIDRLIGLKSAIPTPSSVLSSSKPARASVDRTPEKAQKPATASVVNVPISTLPASSRPVEAVTTSQPQRTVATHHSDRFADYLSFLQTVEAETRDFADTKRVDIFRAELKRTIKDKINVMSKKMATRQEVEDTFDFLNRLLKGEKVADHQGTPICLRGREVAAQWTATFIIDTYLSLVNMDASIVFVAAAVLAGLMRESSAFRRLLIAKIARASTLLSLDPAKCASEAMRVTVAGADAKNAWMSRECALVRLYVAVHATHDAPNGRGRAPPDGPSTLWRLFADLLNFAPAPIATPTVMHELITIGGWLLNDIYGKQFRKLLQCAQTQLLPKLDRSQTRLGEAAAVVTLEITLSKGNPKKPEGFMGFAS